MQITGTDPAKTNLDGICRRVISNSTKLDLVLTCRMRCSTGEHVSRGKDIRVPRNDVKCGVAFEGGKVPAFSVRSGLCAENYTVVLNTSRCAHLHLLTGIFGLESTTVSETSYHTRLECLCLHQIMLDYATSIVS